MISVHSWTGSSRTQLQLPAASSRQLQPGNSGNNRERTDGRHARSTMCFSKTALVKHFYSSRISSKHLGKLFFNTYKFVLACTYGKFNHMCKYNNVKKKRCVVPLLTQQQRVLSVANAPIVFIKHLLAGGIKIANLLLLIF